MRTRGPQWRALRRPRGAGARGSGSCQPQRTRTRRLAPIGKFGRSRTLLPDMKNQRFPVAVGVAALALAVAVPAWAAVDRETTLSATTTKFDWTGGPGNAAGVPGPAAAQ